MIDDDTRRIVWLGLVAAVACFVFPPACLAAWAAGGVAGYRGHPWRGAGLILASIVAAVVGVTIIGGTGV